MLTPSIDVGWASSPFNDAWFGNIRQIESKLFMPGIHRQGTVYATFFKHSGRKYLSSSVLVHL